MIAIAATMTLMVWRTRQRLLQILPPLTIVRYWSDRGMRPEGYAGMVKATVGSDRYLIRACKAGFKQHIVSADFFTESRAFIFDTFDELKEAKQQRYPRKAADSQTA